MYGTCVWARADAQCGKQDAKVDFDDGTGCRVSVGGAEARSTKHGTRNANINTGSQGVHMRRTRSAVRGGRVHSRC